MPPTRLDSSFRQHPPLRLLAGLAMIAILASGARYALSFGWINLFSEGSWVELVQVITWLAGACWALWMIPRTPPGRDRAMIFWLAIIAALAAAREQDMQELLNPDAMGPLGVSFRIAWWLDGSVSLALKLGWLAIAALIGAALTLPLLKARPKLIRLILGRDLAIWLFGIGGFFLMLGYAADDLFGRGLIMSTQASVVLEESSELIGVILVFASIVVTARTRLDDREGVGQKSE